MGLLVISCFAAFVLFCICVFIWAMRSLDHDGEQQPPAEPQYRVSAALWSALAIPVYLVGLLAGVAVLAASAGFQQGREKALRLYKSLS